MNENRFLQLMMKARTFSGRGEHFDYWHGYQRGLRRGFQGDLFGTEAEHQMWMRLAEHGPDDASRERGRGYRDGLIACRSAADDDLSPSTPPSRTGDPRAEKNRRQPGRR